MSVQSKKRNCPREAFLSKNYPRAVTKYDVLNGVVKQVCMTINPKTISQQKLASTIFNEFASLENLHMLAFEAKGESATLTDQFVRFVKYLKTRDFTIVARNYLRTIKFAGSEESHSAYWILEFPDRIEAVRVSRKEPEYSYRGRIKATQPKYSKELLMLQMLGEAFADENGIKKQVYGAIYYLKNKDDSSIAMIPDYENSMGKNIIKYHFTEEDKKVIEQDALDSPPSIFGTCEPENCGECPYTDLCHLEFKKRIEMEDTKPELHGYDELNLTPAQQSFVLFRDGECRVNAVAGSGKTTIVALRTAALIESGEDPKSILMVTFSEKAKEEMSNRLKMFATGKVMSGTDLNISDVDVETFNSFGQHLLDVNYAVLGYTTAPSIIDEVRKKDIIIEILMHYSDLPLDFKNPFLSMKTAEGAVTKISRYIDTMKSRHVETVSDVELAINETDRAADYLEIYNEYNRKLKEQNLIDYEDQLRLLLILANNGIFEKLPYKHIVIDEFQDSNPNQIAIILEMKKRNKNIRSLAVVGDELQSIYGFRNATPKNLIDFGNYFPNMVDIDLTSNFRSQKPIIDVANNIIRKTSRLGKEIRAFKNSTNVKPAILEIKDEGQEEDLYTRQVVKLIRNGTKPQDIAILCRTRAELLKIQASLEKAGIPTILKVPEVIANTPYVKAIIALASFIKDPNDYVSLALFAKSLGQDPFDKNSLEDSAKAITKAFDIPEEIGKINAFMEFTEDATEDYIAKSFIEQLKGMKFTTLDQYLDYCIKYRDYGVRDSKSTRQEETDRVTLITTHSSKGLEWDTVLLSLKKFPIDEESQRLFYVGVTRAKERLLVTYTQSQQLLADLLTA